MRNTLYIHTSSSLAVFKTLVLQEGPLPAPSIYSSSTCGIREVALLRRACVAASMSGASRRAPSKLTGDAWTLPRGAAGPVPRALGIGGVVEDEAEAAVRREAGGEAPLDRG